MDRLTSPNQLLGECLGRVTLVLRGGGSDPVHRFREVDRGRTGGLEVVEDGMEPFEERLRGRQWGKAVCRGAGGGDEGFRWGFEATGEEEGDDERREGGNGGCSSDLRKRVRQHNVGVVGDVILTLMDLIAS